MLERMERFFEARLAEYDRHMMEEIAGAREFYAETAAALPMHPGCRVLDLGCGTGLELEAYFRFNPAAQVTGIDLSPAMLGRLKEKFPEKPLRLICGSYFEVEFSEGYDAAVSVESLHHFPAAQKAAFYRRLYEALSDRGYLILTDYFAASEDLEKAGFAALEEKKREEGIRDEALYHYDTPLTAEHEMRLLQEAGFADTAVVGTWGDTRMIRAEKSRRNFENRNRREI